MDVDDVDDDLGLEDVFTVGITLSEDLKIQYFP